MKIQWLGHSRFRIVGSKTVVTDPFGGIGLAFPPVRADIVTVSHGHFDHNAADGAVRGYNTSHDDAQGAKRGGNIVYLITMDGITIAHLGDLGCMPDHSVLGALEGADVLLIPVGGNYTIDGKTAAAIAAQVRPRTVIPMHYKTPGLTVNVADASDFLSRVEGVEHIPGSQMDITPRMPKVAVFEKPLGQN